jgi:hypothetical protein
MSAGGKKFGRTRVQSYVLTLHQYLWLVLVLTLILLRNCTQSVSPYPTIFCQTLADQSVLANMPYIMQVRSSNIPNNHII